MKKITMLVLGLMILLGSFGIANADVYVRDYNRRDGTHVESHHRSNPDGIRSNNWSCCGNTNPYTGAVGSGD